MHYRFVIIFLVFTSSTLYSQQLTYKTVDSITYSQFLNQKYEDLIDTAESALYEDIDFFYLRMRLGIAYYSTTDYFNALPHFIKANQMNPADTICQEYLFYSYVFTDRIEESKLFADKLSKAMQNKINYKRNFIESVSLSYGYGYTKNLQEGKTKEITANRFIYAEASYQGPFHYVSGLVEQNVKNKLKLLYGMWYYNTQSMGAIQISNKVNYKEFKNNHYQYCLAASYYKKGWDVSLAGSYYVHNASSCFGMYDSNTNLYDFKTTETRINSYAAVIGIGKRFNKIHPIVNIATSNFVNRIQVQTEGSVIFYPFWNSNLYTVTSVAYQNDDSENKFVFFQKLGSKVTKRLWVEESFSIGDHSNYVSKYAFLTYNTMEPVKIIVGIDFKYYFKHLEVDLGYRLQQLEGEYTYYDTPTVTKTKQYNYINHLTTATLKWNF